MSSTSTSSPSHMSSPLCPSTTSPNEMFHVLDYSPHEGEKGVPITVRIHFNQGSSHSIFVRLVVGSKAVATTVRELPNINYGRWQLDATIPSLDPSNLSDKVLLTVQALDEHNQLLHSATFGDFSYWLSDRSKTSCPSPKSEPVDGNSGHRRQASLDLVHANSPPFSDSPALRRRAATTSGARPVIPAVSTPAHFVALQKSRPLKGAPRRIRANSLMRSKFASSKDIGEDLYPQTPILELLTPLGSMCLNWDPSEVRAGRRLVRFQKVQDGRKLMVSCQSIRQEDYQDNDSVISCIYRGDTDSHYVTSVDVLYLLERLTNDEFPVEEKNRLRRNLEGLRPTTVSKHKAGFESFFQRIMKFPDPKPRNIEKDLKVFEWSLLGQALEKVLSKYSVYIQSSPTDSSASLPSEPNDDYPPYDDHVGHHPASHGLPKSAQTAPLIPKFEPSFDDRSILLLSTQDGSEVCVPHHPEHAYDTLQHYPLYPSDPTPISDRGSTHGEASSFNNWAENGTGDMGLEDYPTLAAFHLAEPSDSSAGRGMQNSHTDYQYNYSTDSLQYPRETSLPSTLPPFYAD
ncbi:hypothetical protein E1B28_009924 [Marasmius oreades]|uniref:DUF7082 domain-containing protein n=1 Tax=Marasmius oreades TaxID=181124 RepID=A0A9P7UQL5_9AGAR|nr:uncharacterized protein E1B28_009924 [Marasmius oreades]KAG7090842.1 hypothetical protein E1B28_009924 [Marasmius oreades]